MTDSAFELEKPASMEKNHEPYAPSGAIGRDDATDPHQRLLSENIEIARESLSDEAIEYLSGFARRHPRFDTVRGLEQWALDAQEMLHVHDHIWCHVRNPPVNAKSADELSVKYAKGKLSASVFWQGLDELVSSAALSDVAQREMFWMALRKEDRERLLQYCPLFDPKEPIWETPDSSDAKLAEQRLSRTVMFLRLYDWETDLRKTLRDMDYAYAEGSIAAVAILILCRVFVRELFIYLAAFVAFQFLLMLGLHFGCYRRLKRAAHELAAKRQQLLHPQA